MAEVVRKYSLGKTNARGLTLFQFCATNKLLLTNTIFKHKPNRRFTWISPDGTVKNQIDFIITNQDNKCNIKNSRSYQSADIGSDHSLVLATVSYNRIKSKKPRKKHKQFDVAKLIDDKEIANTFQITIGGAFAPLMSLNAMPIDDLYEKFKTETNKVTSDIVGLKRSKGTEGLGKDTELLCKNRRKARLDFIKDPDNVVVKERYRSLNKAVKREIKLFKKKKLDSKIQQMERDLCNNNSYNLYKNVGELEGRSRKPINSSTINKVTNKPKLMKS